MNLTQIIHATDANGRPTAIIPPPDNAMVIILAAGQNKNIVVPAGASRVLFSATAPFWARIGGTASVPSADILDGTAPELNPLARMVGGGQSIGLAAASPCIVNLCFFGGRQ